MKQSSKRLVSLFVAIILLFGAFYVYFSYIQPAYGDVKNYRSQVYAREQFINTQKGIVAQVQKTLAAYDNQSAVQSSVSLAIPPQADESGAMTQITSLSEANNLSIQSLSATTPSVNSVKSVNSQGSTGFVVKPLGVLNFQVKIAGTYANFKNFLAGLENNIRIMDVQNITVDELGKPNQDFYSFTLNVVTYYQNP